MMLQQSLLLLQHHSTLHPTKKQQHSTLHPTKKQHHLILYLATKQHSTLQTTQQHKPACR
jgi:hypothetical protein